MKKILSLTIAITLVISTLIFLSGCRRQASLLDFDPSDYVDIADFRNIRLDSEAVEKAIEEMTNQILEQSGSYVDPGRPLQLEDRIIFDFRGVIDFTQLEREIQYGDHINFSYLITVEDEEFFPQDRVHNAFRQFEEDADGTAFLDFIDFDSFMIGHTPQIGEVFSFDIVIPENFAHAPVREKDAVMEVTIHSHFTGEFFDGGTGRTGSTSPPWAPFVLGGGQFIPGFEEEMIGHNILEPSMVRVSFPEDYNPADLAGVEAVFFTYTNGVWEIPTEITDELVMFSDWQWDTAEELLIVIRERAIINLAVEYLAENSVFSSLPESELEFVWEDTIDFYGRVMLEEGFDSFGAMASVINPEWTTDQDFREFYLRPQVEDQVKFTVILYYLGRELNFVYDAAEILSRYADAGFDTTGFEVSEGDIYNEMITEVFDWLLENVVVE